MKLVFGIVLLAVTCHAQSIVQCETPLVSPQIRFINAKVSWVDEGFAGFYPRQVYATHFEKGYGDVPNNSPQLEFLVSCAQSKFVGEFDPRHWSKMAKEKGLATYETMRQIRLLDQVFRGVQRIRATAAERRYLTWVLKLAEVPQD